MGWSGLALALSLWSLAAWAEEPYGIFIQRASLARDASERIISADIDYRFSPAIIEALDNGVPLTFLLDFALVEKRALHLDRVWISARRRIQLRYHPLAQSYQVVDQFSGAIQSFAGLAAVLDTLGHIRGWRIDVPDAAGTPKSLNARLQLQLDIESLPLPLRLSAYLSRDWRLPSPAYLWPAEP